MEVKKEKFRFPPISTPDNSLMNSSMLFPQIRRPLSRFAKVNQSFSGVLPSMKDLTSDVKAAPQRIKRNASIETLEGIREEARLEYDRKKRHPRELLSKIREIERTRAVQPALLALDIGVLHLKKVHNRVHDALLRKQAKLSSLCSEVAECDETSQEQVGGRWGATACTSSYKALADELQTQATLYYLIDREKQRVKMRTVPIAEMQEAVAALKRQIQDEVFRMQRHDTQRLFYESELRRLKSVLFSVKKQRIEGVKKLMNGFSDQQWFLLHYGKEEEAKRAMRGEQMKAEQFLVFEYELELQFGT